MMHPSLAALRMTLIYAVVAGCWILFSDQLLNPIFVQDPLGISWSWWQSVKGLFFVTITSILLYSLMHRQLATQAKAIRAYRESEHRWHRLLDQTPEPVLILDDRRIVYVNNAGVRVLGVAEDRDVINRDVTDFLVDGPAEDTGTTEAVLGKSNEPGPHQCFIAELQGHRRCIDVISSPISFKGRPCVLSVWRDVTRRQEYEQQLLAARDEAENASRIKSTILANLSHEIRTPLTAILGYSEVLIRDPGAPLQESIELIHRSALRLRETLESILMLAELESGETSYEPEPTDIRDVVRATVEIFSGQARRKQLLLDIDVPDTPVNAVADANAVAQIVMNLVSNAIKFTDDGRVTVRLRSTSDAACIEVEDTGIGMRDEFLPRIFDEFVQESQGLDRQFEGSGLGLTIVRQLVELQDGSIAVESEVNAGTRILVKIPAATG